MIKREERREEMITKEDKEEKSTPSNLREATEFSMYTGLRDIEDECK